MKQEQLIWSCWEAELPTPVIPVVTIYMLQKEGSQGP